jgi:hypothetical protein
LFEYVVCRHADPGGLLIKVFEDDRSKTKIEREQLMRSVDGMNSGVLAQDDMTLE